MMGTAGETLALCQVVYLDSNGQWKKADADSETTATLIGITMDAIISGNQGRIQIFGPIGYSIWSWTKGAKLYLSSTPGELTETQPTPTAGGVIKAVAYALTATMINFQLELSHRDDDARMRILTYTGDGNATKAITGCKFEPDYVMIYPQLTGGTYIAYKVTADGLYAFIMRSGSNNVAYEVDHVISLDADGFTVGDGTASTNFMNVLNRVYVAVCFKNYT